MRNFDIDSFIKNVKDHFVLDVKSINKISEEIKNRFKKVSKKEEKGKHPGSKNNNQGISKKRRLMAKKSRKINRQKH